MIFTFVLEASLLLLFLESSNVPISQNQVGGDRPSLSTIHTTLNTSTQFNQQAFPYSPAFSHQNLFRKTTALLRASSSPTASGATSSQQISQNVIQETALNRWLQPMAENIQIAAHSTSFQLTAKPASAFVDSVGVNTHLHYYDTAYGNYSLIKQRLQELGVRHIRDGGSDPTWIERTNELAGLGIRSTIVLDPNIGVGPNSSYNIAPPGYTIAQLIKEKLPNAIAGVEILNEFDFHHHSYFHNGHRLDGSSWVGYLRDITRDTHIAMNSDPATRDIPIIGPSFIYPDSSEKVGMMDQWIDYGNMHPYNYPSHPGNGNLERELANRSKPSGNLPLIATEAGYHTAKTENGVSEAIQAKYIPRMFLNNFNHGVHRTFSYELIDQWPDSSNQESNFGLLRFDGSPKPAFTAQKNLISLLNESPTPFTPGSLKYSISGDTSNLQQTLLQKSNGDFYLLMWLEVPSTEQELSRTINLNLDTPIQSATTFLPNHSTLPTGNFEAPRQLNLDVPDHPIAVRLKPTR